MKGRYGIHGGQYIPETLMSEIHKIEETYEFYKMIQLLMMNLIHY